ncbi:MAG TPA: hypothetical protein PLR69_05935, partial [Candidatus Limiplasma sp.]|nr:hypothetical protein [Candidatus Limiplasma sp.]
MQPIQWTTNHMPKSDDQSLSIMSLTNVEKAYRFHRSFPQYSVTPLANLTGMAARLGLGALCVKDESYRFGLNAFKVLGGSFAIGIARHLEAAGIQVEVSETPLFPEREVKNAQEIRALSEETQSNAGT